MKLCLLLLVLLSICALAKCSLLEMSQVLWTRLLAGGLTKGGILDPLRVPVIKVDQSEGNTSYRIVLRNVEIRGLNLSTLESVHIARGRLKSNLSELEAGYVSYSDLRDLDAIRYRFHTLVKEPKPKNDSESPAYLTQLANLSKVHPTESRNRDPGLSYGRVNNRNPSRTNSDNLRFRNREEVVDLVYAEEYKPFEQQSSSQQKQQGFSTYTEEPQENIGEIKCFGSCIRSRNPSTSSSGNIRRENLERTRGNRKYTEFREQDETSGQDDANVSASESFEQKQRFVSSRQPGERIVSSPETRNNRKYAPVRVEDSRPRETAFNLREYQRRLEAGRAHMSNSSKDTSEKNASEINYQTPPGYVDIVYADNDDQKIKHFAGFRRREDQNMAVYGLEEIIKDLELHNRYIVHNFTKSEALQKRNNMTLAAAESKRIKDMVRYAENFQEKQGYFEQGMQLIYHFGGMRDPNPDDASKNDESNEAKRRKREHDKNDLEDDIMHVIMRLRVPMLRVKADYLLTGKVGREILRGNGLLTGNFTNMIGDFTLELKRVDKNTMIVRAARARLVAENRHVSLQGMREKGPVESVLVHGLMAAEAVAAMIADDLATKALSVNPPTDAMIYKMYSNDPALP